MTHQSKWAADAVERRSVDALVPYARNARTHSDAQVAQIAASIREWGWTVPVLVDETGMIIAGHGRVLAAQRLGINSIPVMVAAGWSEAQKRAYVLADNRLAQNAGWDEDLLALELDDLRTDGFDLPLIGFNEDELAELLAQKTQGLTDPDDAPEPPDNPVTLPGDVWVLGNHRIICGDATNPEDVARVFAGVKPHLMVTDPPYGVDYDPEWRARAGLARKSAKMGAVLNDERADWTEAWRLFPGDVAYVWHGGLHAGTVADSLIAADFSVRAQIIWVKDRFALSRGHYHWQHEPCYYSVRDAGHWSGDRKQSTVWNIPAREDKGFGHGTQKPVACMRRPIENNSSPGQAVYEPFSGSGTTIIAGEMTGRHVLALELNPAYVDVAVLRWQEFTGKSALLESEGQSFDAVKERRHQSVAA